MLVNTDKQSQSTKIHGSARPRESFIASFLFFCFLFEFVLVATKE